MIYPQPCNIGNTSLVETRQGSPSPIFQASSKLIVLPSTVVLYITLVFGLYFFIYHDVNMLNGAKGCLSTSSLQDSVEIFLAWMQITKNMNALQRNKY